MENDRVLQEAVKSNARDNIETMAAVEEIAAVLTGKNQPPQG